MYNYKICNVYVRETEAIRLKIIIIIILFVHKNNFIKTRQPTTRERDRQG